MTTKRATIADVASRAGVSKSAVSKVLRDAYGISDQMRQDVEQAMSELQYRPQIAARGMRGSTYTLGILIPDMRNAFFPDLIDGIWHGLEETPYQPLYAFRHSGKGTDEQMIDLMHDRKLDGFILIAPHIRRDYLWTLAATTPVVVIGRHEKSDCFDTVNNDDELGAKLAVTHLIRQNHKRIAFIGFEYADDALVNPVVFRMRGYVAAMIENKLSANIQVFNGTDGPIFEDHRKLAQEILASENRPTAIFAWTDQVAMTVMSVAHEMGIRVPEDLAIAGYDNSRICDFSQIQLTSVDQDAHLMGTTAAKLLIERIDGRTNLVDFVTQPKLLTRKSSLAITVPEAQETLISI